MIRERKRVLFSWSSGKDSAWALHLLRQQSDVELAGLLTTVNEQFDRVAMHAVRTDLLRRQAESVGLSLRLISLPFPCSNEVYEERLRAVIGAAQSDGIEGVAFGDLFPADVRQYRERMMAITGITPLVPLCGRPTAERRLYTMWRSVTIFEKSYAKAAWPGA